MLEALLVVGYAVWTCWCFHHEEQQRGTDGCASRLDLSNARAGVVTKKGPLKTRLLDSFATFGIYTLAYLVFAGFLMLILRVIP